MAEAIVIDTMIGDGIEIYATEADNGEGTDRRPVIIMTDIGMGSNLGLSMTQAVTLAAKLLDLAQKAVN